MSKLLRLPLVALLLVAMSAVAAFAQSTVTGAIGVVVSDPQGAVVPNATVTALNVETNKEDTATTDDEGRARIVNLQPGTYTVSVNASGFGAFKQEKVVVEVGRVTSIDSRLAVGETSGSVEVTAEAPVINTAQQDFSSNLNQTSINELPINGQRWSNFALLTPASTPDGAFGLISFRGIAGTLNNTTVDGGDNNQAFFSEEKGRTRIAYVVSQAAVREFQVNTSNYSAEYGRSAGGVVNAVTKSGTNEFHGGAFLYDRNNKWGARNPLATISSFDAATGVTTIRGFKPEDVRYRFGGTIGGPIVKDKAFFFFAYDENRRNFPGLGVFSVPNYLTSVNRTLLTATVRGLTNAQIDSGLAFITSLTGEVPRRGDQRIFMPKLDWNITQNNTFTATYNRMRWKSPAGIQTQPINNRGRASFGDDIVRTDSLNLRLASTLSNAAINEARFQYARDFEAQRSQPPLPGEPTTASGGRSPDVFLTNGLEFGTPTFLERTAFPDEKRWQYTDTMTLTVSNHTIKFGADINHVNDLQDNLRNEAGAYSYSNINDFLVDYTNFTSSGALRTANKQCATSTRIAGKCYTSNYNQGFGPTLFQFSTNDINFFVQDDWRVTPHLTLNLGLRYEYQQMPEPFLVNPAIPQTGQLPSDKNNFGPRLGFAYDMTGDGKNSLRGGYGIYFGRIPNAAILNALTNTGVTGSQVQVSLAATVATAPVFPNVLSTAPAGNATINFFKPGFENPLIHQGDLIFEHQIARNTVVSVSYIFSFGKHLPQGADLNLSAPTTTRVFTIPTLIPAGNPGAGTQNGPFAGQPVIIPYFAGARPNPAFGALTEFRDIVESKYHALVLQANRRLTNGLQFQINYTRSSATDTGQGVSGASAAASPSSPFPDNNGYFNVFDPNFEKGTSNFDSPNKFVASIVWNPTPFSKDSDNKVGRAIFNGFTIAPIISMYTGNPYNGHFSGSAPTALFGANQAGGINGSNGSNRFPLISRNAFRKRPVRNVDLRLSRRFHFGEAMNLEVLAESFNLFNRTNVTNVNNTLYRVNAADATLIFDPTFGTTREAGGTIVRERQVQLAVRFEF